MSPGRQARLDAAHAGMKQYLPQLREEFVPTATNLSIHVPYDRPIRHGMNDASYYLYLWVENTPSAFIGWRYNTLFHFHDAATIKVIQGVFHKKEPKPVPPQGWPVAMVSILAELLHSQPQLDVSYLAIERAQDNFWYPPVVAYDAQGKPDELMKQRIRMQRYYDGTAQTLGFESEKHGRLRRYFKRLDQVVAGRAFA